MRFAGSRIAYLIFEELVNFGTAEGGVSPEIDARDLSLIAFDNRLQRVLPAVGAVDVAGS
jgi:hypothetical protein